LKAVQSASVSLSIQSKPAPHPSARLQELEAEGLISRQAFAEIPPRTEYRLTDKGKLLIPVIHSMREVGKEFI